LPWGPEDWDALLLAGGVERPRSFEPVRAVERVLLRVPDRRRKTVADLGCGLGAHLPFLASCFARVIAVDYAPRSLSRARGDMAGAGVEFRRRDLRDLKPLRGRLDVAVAIDSILGPRSSDVDRIIEQVHRSLVEGGLFVSTFPAVSCAAGPYELRLGEGEDVGEPHRFHEIELQYRMRRAGFRGVRFRRFGATPERAESLLCVAVRRANN